MSDPNQFKFNEHWTYGDWGCLVEKDWTFDDAAPKEEYIEVPDGDGKFDVSEAVNGYVVFDMRNFKANLIFPQYLDTDQRIELKKRISNAINGKRVKMIKSTDPEYYYLGRVRLDGYDTSRGVDVLTVTGSFEPYKYKTRLTEISYSNVTSLSIQLRNERMPAVPTILSSQALTVKSDDGTTLQITSNMARECPELILLNEETNWTLTASSAATVTITYQEGSL